VIGARGIGARVAGIESPASSRMNEVWFTSRRRGAP
jgi:hypothetical protein